ncbi:4-galactosyl-N-acetylglucosaminide 3-alpha-L-fucosyltransferase 9-like [Leucoraja erinacea]|uniref:4-galactosyl-N-acetylglucosaminide 3-alpha-L-fucosyltransferase 9-like n=1 Tax=Leucoraja erinaceus TaxID=7782 RepID=UPI002455B95E|nr:4-galactosyl-N-acetylglucosaminide 3-alpha-L-fucosyltransferase 9-like [Leucoraja erinacea]
MITVLNKRILRIFLHSIIILGCLSTLLLLYMKPLHSWIYGPTTVVDINLSSPSKNETIVLIWLWPFGQPFELSSCKLEFNIEDCYLTADRKLYNKSHAVLFHHEDIRRDLANLPLEPRPPFQKWVWMNLESPTHTSKRYGLNQLFNLTLSYRQDSDIQVPYGSLTKSKVPLDFKMPSKNVLVCWIISNWDYEHPRVKYYYMLRKYVKIIIYGRFLWHRLSDDDLIPTISTCKFYLAFENSIHKDYITEKLYNALLAGSVPVVLGPSRENYENYIPANSFIHVDDFLSPKELADYLHMLDGNENLYMSYFKWRKYYEVRITRFWSEHVCSVCENIQQHKEHKSLSSLEKWFWN